MPIYPHTIDDHTLDWQHDAEVDGLLDPTCEECGFCQCPQLSGIHGVTCSHYDHIEPQQEE